VTAPRSILVIGGAGFIGSNLANAFLKHGARVTVYDNFSRRGAIANARWLRDRYSRAVRILRGDILRGRARLVSLIDQADLVIHNAGQVAVTTSVSDPRSDFEANAHGTFEVLEALRDSRRRPPLIFSSTNKVYGGLSGLTSREVGRRYVLANSPRGVSEAQPLDFYSPYGCSKGAADQYVRDYARIYGLRTVVFRKSCIYGPRQFGVEDQGWVAWFTIAALCDHPITIYGDGKQVRDVLYIDDLVRAYQAAYRHIDDVAGEVFNIGGGPGNTLSLRELLDMLRRVTRRPIPVRHEGWRSGDQRVYVSDTLKARRLLGWTPRVTPEAGVMRLYRWVRENLALVGGIGVRGRD
jgi:CDP-paratose 2-epimerase